MARFQDHPEDAPRGLEQDRGALAAVVIGRNEGQRLLRCLRSLAGVRIVYVDSASTDGSAEAARALGAEVIALDLSLPFTAARARNAGWRALGDERYVQFVDGDCEVVEGWIEAARAALDADRSLAAVAGRRRERDLEGSIYNRVCDVEWDTPIGEADAIGGDAMMRLDALRAVGGFDETLIAGEEPELCLRLRRRGHRILRLDRDMTLHDAAMTRASEWWKRAVRAGHAFAEGADRFGDGPERHWVKESRRIWLWGAAVPAAALLGALPTLGLSLGLFAGYPISTYRTYKHTRERGRSAEDSALYALACTVGRFAELQGALRYHKGRWLGRRSELIEYKR